VEGSVRDKLAASADEIHAAAVANGMRSLFDEGVQLVLDATMSLDEVRRITGDPAFQHKAPSRARSTRSRAKPA
jgi:hypothetical protein